MNIGLLNIKVNNDLTLSVKYNNTQYIKLFNIIFSEIIIDDLIKLTIKNSSKIKCEHLEKYKIYENIIENLNIENFGTMDDAINALKAGDMSGALNDGVNAAADAINSGTVAFNSGTDAINALKAGDMSGALNAGVNAAAAATAAANDAFNAGDMSGAVNAGATVTGLIDFDTPVNYSSIPESNSSPVNYSSIPESSKIVTDIVDKLGEEWATTVKKFESSGASKMETTVKDTIEETVQSIDTEFNSTETELHNFVSSNLTKSEHYFTDIRSPLINHYLKNYLNKKVKLIIKTFLTNLQIDQSYTKFINFTVKKFDIIFNNFITEKYCNFNIKNLLDNLTLENYKHTFVKFFKPIFYTFIITFINDSAYFEGTLDLIKQIVLEKYKNNINNKLKKKIKIELIKNNLEFFINDLKLNQIIKNYGKLKKINNYITIFLIVLILIILFIIFSKYVIYK